MTENTKVTKVTVKNSKMRLEKLERKNTPVTACARLTRIRV